VPEYSFTIGELLPADDILAQFITVLAMISNDWLRLMADLESDEDRGADSEGSNLWNYRLQAALHYEAADFLRFSRRKAEVREFLADLSEEDQQDYDAVQAGLQDDSTAGHGDWFKLNRNRVFHYSTLGSDSPVRTALLAAANDTGRIDWEPRLGDRRFPFADQVALEWQGTAQKQAEQLERMSSTVMALARVCEAAIAKYLVDKKVARLADEGA
jgi:hypothetical protein